MNPHSKLASFYRYFYMEENLPNNLCNYVWSLLFAFACTPLTWLAMLHNRIYNPIRKEKRVNYMGQLMYYYKTPYKPIQTGVGIIFSFLAFMIGAVTLKIFEHISKVEIIRPSEILLGCIKIYGVGILTVFTSIALFYGLMFLWRLIPKKKEKEETNEEFHARMDARNKAEMERRIYKENNPSFLTLVWRWLVAFKEKNCPMITWDYTKEK